MNGAPKQWDEQGCPVCRAGWESGSLTGLRPVGSNDELHARLYQCEICRAYWEEGLESRAHELAVEEADARQDHHAFRRDPLGG